MAIYRKIWEKYNGLIPMDENGRSYEIHHIDGNRSNNHIDNLKCVSIQEHYDIHYNQGDWGACLKITKRMEVPRKILSELASLNNKKRVLEGKNVFVGPEINSKRIKEGTHHLVGGELQRKQVKEGTHNFIKDPPHIKQFQNGTHPTQIEWKCEMCGKIGKNLGLYSRHHGKNCKIKAGQ